MNAPPLPAAAQGTGDTGPQVSCTVLWVDIDGYGTAAVTDQVRQRDHLNAAIEQALASVSPDDRIVLDTDKGAAICFLGPADTVLPVAVALHAAFGAVGAPTETTALRAGLSHGPVALVNSGGSTPTLMGDGVVVAERLAAFAARGQTIASRPYVTAASAQRPRLAAAFETLGTRTDAHLRTHEIFAVRDDMAASLHPPSAPWWHGERAAAAAAVVAGVLLLAAFLTGRGPAPGAPRAPAPVEAATGDDMRGLSDPPSTFVPGPAETAAGDASRSAPPGAMPSSPAAASSVREKPQRARQGTVAAAPVGSPGTRPTRAVTAERAVIALAISPWGEVIINGSKVGVSPPMDSVEVPAGQVTVEIRNGEAAPYSQSMALAPGQHIRVKHKF